MTDTETETFYPRQILPIPIPRLFFETKFSETDTETFFPRPNFPIPIPKLSFRDKIFRDRYRDFLSETKFFDTDTETTQKIVMGLETETETETFAYD